MFSVKGSGFRVQGSGFRVQGSGFRVQGVRFRTAVGPIRGSQMSDLPCQTPPKGLPVKWTFILVQNQLLARMTN